MTVVQRDGSTVGTYTYNALGQRTAKVVTLPTASSQRFAYDEASQLIGEYGDAARDYVWLGDLPVAVVDTANGVSAVSYVHADGLNTPRAVTDASGATAWQLAYQGNAFGEKQATSASGFAYSLRLPGQYYDAESGLFYNGARHYESATGRFPQSDPTGLKGGPSTYLYGFGNPIRYTDKSGLLPNPLEATCIDPVQPFCWAGIGIDLAATVLVVNSVTGSAQDNPQSTLQFAKPIKGSKPKDCPAGTRPIDQFPGLSKDDVHTIKDGVGAGPKDWTGIAPNGDVITGDHEGNAVNNGPLGDYLPGSNE